jgi:metal-dependent hydrolase (beta-lactamase superfamily II)
MKIIPIKFSYLFDTGVSENGVIHNADIFGIDITKIDGIKSWPF